MRHTTAQDSPGDAPADEYWPVVELRQYTLRPGRRDEMVDLFDRELVEPQEAAGMRVVGQFRDEDAEDRFVWLRAFPGMAGRGTALTAFYVHGAAWRRHRDAANATMVDSDDVLLLRPTGADRVLRYPGPRPPVDARELPGSRLLAVVYPLPGPIDDEFVAFFAEEVRPLLVETGAAPLVTLETEPAANTFPRLPVRTGDHVLVWLAAFPDAAARQRHLDDLARHPRWSRHVRPALWSRLAAPPQQLRLAPTARSLLR